MNKNPKISFVIPIYNVEQYLHQCVDSLLLQDYNDYEIILIDDGSNDSCPQICDGFAKNKSQIRVVHQNNRGVSVARNVGVADALGEYICFIDGDDYWNPNVLGSLMQQVEREQLDVLRFGVQKIQKQPEGTHICIPLNSSMNPIDLKGDVVSGETYLKERMGYDCFPVQFIMKREIVGEFTQEIVIYEDAEWLPRMMLQAKRVNNTNLLVYNYCIREGSAMQSKGDVHYIRKRIEGRLAGIKTFNALSVAYPNVLWLKKMCSIHAYDILCSIAAFPFAECNAYITRLYAYNVFPLSLVNIGGKSNRNIFVANHFGPRMFCLLNRFKTLIKKY